MSSTRRTFLQTTSAVVLSASLPSAGAPAENDLRLWYRQPAPDWNEALPIGNGWLGAMIFGGVREERLQLNADTLTSEEPGTSDLRLDVTQDFNQVEAMLRSRQFAEAGEVITKHWTGRSWPCYQPMSDLYLRFEEDDGASTEYVRELDLVNALSRVTKVAAAYFVTRTAPRPFAWRPVRLIS